MLLLALALLGTPQDAPPEAARPRPNVLLILTDDMGYGDLSCQGSVQVSTPNIDRLAAGGVRAAQGYVSSMVCAPSRAGLITGRYQNRFGFEHNLSVPEHVKPEWCGLPTDEATMADHLSGLGYRTMAIGKWHLGTAEHHHPLRRGFDRHFGFLGGSHGYFPTPEKHQLERDGHPVTEIRTPYLTDWLTLEAIDWANADHGGAPWFCYLAYNTPHTPLQAKAEDEALFGDVVPPKRRTYCAMQHNLDRNVGRILDALEATGQLDNTFIVFINDNGGSCDASFAINAPLRGQKSTTLEGGVRVPMLFHWPARLPAASVFPYPVSSLDLAPTIVSAAGGDPKSLFRPRPDGEPLTQTPARHLTALELDGVDITRYLRGEMQQGRPHRSLYWRISQRGAAIRRDDWKLIRLPHRAPELYDLSKDESERSNLAAEQPDRVRDLLEELHEWECSFARNPMWESDVFWASYNRKLYDREYTLTQPR